MKALRAAAVVVGLAVATLVVGLAAAGCGPRRGTPTEAFESLRAALKDADGATFYELLDSESAARGRAEVRERRALLARGDDPAVVLQGMPLTADELNSGEESDTAKLFYPRRSKWFQEAPWFSTAAVVRERPESPDAVLVELRGEDGTARTMWFIREHGRWCFDMLRTARQ